MTFCNKHQLFRVGCTALMFVSGAIVNSAYADDYLKETKEIELEGNTIPQVGAGWNTSKEVVAGECLAGFTERNAGMPNDPTTYEIRSGTNSYHLHKTMKKSSKRNLQASLSASGWGAQVSAAFQHDDSNDLSKQFNGETHSSWVMIQQIIVKNAKTVHSDTSSVLQLKDAYQSMYHDDAAEFRRQCGDGYIKTVHHGASQKILVTVSNTAKFTGSSVRTAFSNALSAEGGYDGFGASVEGGVSGGASDGQSNTNQNSSVESHLSVTAQIVGVGGAPASSNIKEAIENYKSFPQTAQSGDGAPIRFVVAPYPKPSTPTPPPANKTSDSKTLNLTEELINQTPYDVLAREYAKWTYLARKIDDVLSLYSAPATRDINYTIFPGGRAQYHAIMLMQDMAFQKQTIIVEKAKQCVIARTSAQQEDSKTTKDTLEQACSLSGSTVYFSLDPNNISVNANGECAEGKYQPTQISGICISKTATVPVNESDIHYLARMPLSTAFGAKIAAEKKFVDVSADEMKDNTNVTWPLDGLFDDALREQIIHIYKERCAEGETNSFCEKNTNIVNAVAIYSKRHIARVSSVLTNEEIDIMAILSGADNVRNDTMVSVPIEPDWSKYEDYYKAATQPSY